MIRLFFAFILFIVFSIGCYYVGINYYRTKRRKEIEEMTPHELVTAVIRKEISIIEVPQKHKIEVDEIINRIQLDIHN